VEKILPFTAPRVNAQTGTYNVLRNPTYLLACPLLLWVTSPVLASHPPVASHVLRPTEVLALLRHPASLTAQTVALEEDVSQVFAKAQLLERT